MKKVCVLGAGTMGSGIAQLIATHGFTVHLVDLNIEILNGAKEKIKRNIEKFLVQKNKISQEQAENILNRILLFENRDEAIKGIDMVIEAIFEDMELKKSTFRDLDQKCDKQVILASNTSSLSITEIASEATHQERIIGLHFFNPAPIMKLIELIKGLNTSEETLNTTKNFAEQLNKVVITVNDSPGFVTTRLIYVLCNEAINILREGVASVEEIDTACKLAFNFPMGPLELSDLVSNEIYLHIGEYLTRELGSKYLPSPILKQMVNAGLLGRKTKKGFYNY
ncbi:MAG: 3-hydroxyacyl-CoA dehydrogenase family protein [Promethearchaeota archaeon]